MKPLLLLHLVLPIPAMAGPCGMFGNNPSSIGGCTVRDPSGVPSVRITEPCPGCGYRATPLPGYQPVTPIPTYQPGGVRGSAPYVWTP